LERRSKITPILLLAPAILIFVFIFVAPFIYLIFQSFWHYETSYVSKQVFTLENYIKLFSDPYYWRIYWRTFRLSVISTLITMILAYPISRMISRMPPGKKGLVTTLIALPMIGGGMIQAMGWMTMMMPYGAINGILLSLGIIKEKMTFLGTETGILIGLVQSFIPLMSLPLIASLGAIDPTLEDASKSLGASPLRTFFEIILPLSIPGAVSGMVLTFMANLTMYVTPSILGQGKIQVFGSFVYQQAISVGNWPFSSAFSLFFLLIMGVTAFLSSWITKSIQKSIYKGNEA